MYFAASDLSYKLQFSKSISFSTSLHGKMQKLTIAKTMHGCFLAPKQHISPKRDEGDSSETEEETDEDDSDYNFELGDQHLSSRGSDKMSVNSRRLKKTTGRVLALIFLCRWSV